MLWAEMGKGAVDLGGVRLLGKPFLGVSCEEVQDFRGPAQGKKSPARFLEAALGGGRPPGGVSAPQGASQAVLGCWLEPLLWQPRVTWMPGIPELAVPPLGCSTLPRRSPGHELRRGWEDTEGTQRGQKHIPALPWCLQSYWPSSP